MSSTFGSYKVDRVVFHLETTFDVDESVAWTPIGGVNEIGSRPALEFAENKNLQRSPGDHQLTRKIFDITIRGRLKRKRTSPAWHWGTFGYYGLGSANAGVPTDNIASLAISERLNIATPQYKVWRGVKIASYRVLGRLGNMPIEYTATLRGATESLWVTSDPISGTVTASIESSGQQDQTFPQFGVDVGAQYGTGYSSIKTRVSEFEYGWENTLEPRGQNADEATRCRSIDETDRAYTARVVMDFINNDEMNNFLNATKRSLRFTDADNRITEITSGVWMSGEGPASGSSLIAHTLNFVGTGIRVSG